MFEEIMKNRVDEMGMQLQKQDIIFKKLFNFLKSIGKNVENSKISEKLF